MKLNSPSSFVKYALLFIGLCLNFLFRGTSTAQTYRNVCFTNPANNEYGDKIAITYDNHFIISSTIRIGSLGLPQLAITKTDSSFNPIFTKLYGYSNVNYNTSGMELTNDSSILIVSSNSEYDSLNQKYRLFSTIAKLNMSGDTIHTLNISDSLNNLYLKPIHVSGDSLFLIGSVGSTKQFEPNEGVFIAYNHKTNSVIFKRIFNKHPNYNTNLWHGVFNEKKQTFLIAGTAQIDTTSSNFLQLFLIECNTNGLAINMYSMSDTVDYSYLQLATSKKSGKIFCGVEKFSANQKSSFIYFTLDSLNNKVISKRIYDGIQDKLFFTNAFIDSTDNILLSLGPRILNIDSIGDIIGYNYIFQNNTYPLANILYKAGTVIGNKAYFIGSVKLLLSSAFDIIIAETDLNGIGCFASNLTESSVNYPIAINPDSISIDTSHSFNYTYGLDVLNSTLGLMNLCPNSSNEISELNDIEIKVSPNPFQDKITITCDNPLSSINISISSMNGILMEKCRVNDLSTLEINLENLPSGIYILSIVYNDKSKINKKLIKINN